MLRDLALGAKNSRMNDLERAQNILEMFKGFETQAEADTFLWASIDTIAKVDKKLLLTILITYAFNWPNGQWWDDFEDDDDCESFADHLFKVMEKHGVTISA